MSSSSLLDLPDVNLHQILLFMDATDILNLLSTHPQFHHAANQDPFLWRFLWNHRFSESNDDDDDEQRQQQVDYKCLNDEKHCGKVKGGGSSNAAQAGSTISTTAAASASAAKWKRTFLLSSYATKLPCVKWVPQRDTYMTPSSREGHVACVLGQQDEYLMITSGFSDDVEVHVKYVGIATADGTSTTPVAAAAAAAKTTKATSATNLQNIRSREWYRLPRSRDSIEPSFVYGASWNRLDAYRAVRFGGFRGGGYSAETSQVLLFTLHDTSEGGEGVRPDGRNNVNFLTCKWERIQTTIQQPHPTSPSSSSSLLSSNASPQAASSPRQQQRHRSRHLADSWESKLARAYHTATLLPYQNYRYLLILGGMQSSHSILEPALLDTHTWSWVDTTVTPICYSSDAPSERHGHSVVLDPRRSRLVLFGGGNGTDLLRSGKDNTEVWELKMPKCVVATRNVTTLANNNNCSIENETHEGGDITATFPWQWNKLITDQFDAGLEDETMDWGPEFANFQNADHEGVAVAGYEGDRVGGIDANGLDNMAAAASSTAPQQQIVDPSSSHYLHPAETLILGRCHTAHKTSPNTVVLCFGSGRPSTNGLICFDLESNSFFRPKHIRGPLPVARFTCASAYLPKHGCLFFHGGYSTQLASSIEDVQILDLAPAVRCPVVEASSDSIFFSDTSTARRYVSHEPVTDAEALRRRSAGRYSIVDFILMNLASETENNRRDTAGRILASLRMSQRLGGRAAMLLHMIASGQMQMETTHQMDVDEDGGQEENENEDSDHSEWVEGTDVDEDDDDDDDAEYRRVAI